MLVWACAENSQKSIINEYIWIWEQQDWEIGQEKKDGKMMWERMEE